MVFTAPAFLLYFLPGIFLGFVLLSMLGMRRLTLAWLTLASFLFYGWARPEYLLLLAGSILFNYVVAGQLLKSPNRVVLALGIVANTCVLAYYKYTHFGLGVAGWLLSRNWEIPQIILPLGISFFTFKQIAYLIDAKHGELTDHDFLNYCLFVSFFPQIVAGPITLQREMLPQFNDSSRVVPRWDTLATGTTLFLVGLFKKVLVANSIDTYTGKIFETARHSPVQLLHAWSGAVAYAFQIYFDFSGYSDMAIGLGLMFGIALPLNFNSPYKAKNIIEYWSRWHMTLTRFLTAYIYTPLTTSLTRGRVQRGKSIMSGGVMKPWAFVQLVAFPVLVTMFISGVWHGAGWQFVIFGLLHGFYIVTAHAWRRFKKARGIPLDSESKVRVAGSVLLTFLCATIALVFFRAADVSSAVNIVSGMAGVNGAILPRWVEQIPVLGTLVASAGVQFGKSLDQYLLRLAPLVAFVVWALPNPYQWMWGQPTAFGANVDPPKIAGRFTPLAVSQPRILTGILVGLISAVVLLRSFSAAPTEFIYAQF